MSELIIQTKAFHATDRTRQCCIACGGPIVEYGLKVETEKETHGYDCYRNLWEFKKTLRKLQDTKNPENIAIVRAVIALIESGMSIKDAKIYYKFWKKHGTKFIGAVQK